jgi:hypothetical protein
MGSQRFILIAAVVGMTLSIGACFPDDEPIGPARITKLQAYFCVVRGATECQVRGDAIPSDQLPPTDEAFMVWAWHPGFNTTKWRVVSPVAVDTIPQKLGQDSVGTWIALNGASAKRYTLHVEIVGVGGVIISQDSLVWNYP